MSCRTVATIVHATGNRISRACASTSLDAVARACSFHLAPPVRTEPSRGFNSFGQLAPCLPHRCTHLPTLHANVHHRPALTSRCVVPHARADAERVAAEAHARRRGG